MSITPNGSLVSEDPELQVRNCRPFVGSQDLCRQGSRYRMLRIWPLGAALQGSLPLTRVLSLWMTGAQKTKKNIPTCSMPMGGM